MLHGEVIDISEEEDEIVKQSWVEFNKGQDILERLYDEAMK